MTSEEVQVVLHALEHSARMYIELNPQPTGEIKKYLTVVFRIRKRLIEVRERSAEK